MQVAQRVDGHILPAIDGQEANWMRGVELLLIASVPGGYSSQYTRHLAIVHGLLTKYEREPRGILRTQIQSSYIANTGTSTTIALALPVVPPNWSKNKTTRHCGRIVSLREKYQF